MNLSDTIATALEYVFGVWAVWWGIVSVCAPTRIQDREDSLLHRVMVWSIKRSILKQSTERPLTISQIRFLGITYLVGGILFLTDATVRSFFGGQTLLVATLFERQLTRLNGGGGGKEGDPEEPLGEGGKPQPNGGTRLSTGHTSEFGGNAGAGIYDGKIEGER